MLVDELLADIELSRSDPMAVVRKASRLARLLDDTASMRWLAYEVTGYPTPGDADAWEAAGRSCRIRESESGPQYPTAMLGQIRAEIDALTLDLNATADVVEGQWALAIEKERQRRRDSARRAIADRQAIVDRVLGAIHSWVAERYQELRFGSAVAGAFDVVRRQVDGMIAAFVPDALPMLSAAFENASSGNPEHWQKLVLHLSAVA